MRISKTNTGVCLSFLSRFLCRSSALLLFLLVPAFCSLSPLWPVSLSFSFFASFIPLSSWLSDSLASRSRASAHSPASISAFGFRSLLQTTFPYHSPSLVKSLFPCPVAHPVRVCVCVWDARDVLGCSQVIGDREPTMERRCGSSAPLDQSGLCARTHGRRCVRVCMCLVCCSCCCCCVCHASSASVSLFLDSLAYLLLSLSRSLSKLSFSLSLFFPLLVVFFVALLAL